MGTGSRPSSGGSRPRPTASGSHQAVTSPQTRHVPQTRRPARRKAGATRETRAPARLLVFFLSPSRSDVAVAGVSWHLRLMALFLFYFFVSAPGSIPAPTPHCVHARDPRFQSAPPPPPPGSQQGATRRNKRRKMRHNMKRNADTAAVA